MTNKNCFIIVFSTSLMACSASLPSVPSDIDIITNNELCEAFGIAYAAKDTSLMSKILEEGELRGIQESDTCKMFVEIGYSKYIEAQSSPSGFESFINAIDAIGTAGHTNKHEVLVR